MQVRTPELPYRVLVVILITYGTGFLLTALGGWALYQSAISHMDDTADSIVERILGQLEPKIEANAAAIDRNARMIQQNGDQITLLRERVAALETSVDELNRRVLVLEEKVDDLAFRAGALESRMTSLESRVGDLESRVGDLESRVGDLAISVRTLAGQAGASIGNDQTLESVEELENHTQLLFEHAAKLEEEANIFAPAENRR